MSNPGADLPRSPRSPRDRFGAPPIAMFGAALLAIVAIPVAAAPWLTHTGPTTPDYDALLESPSSRHWFGTDDLGRDIFSRVLHGGRLTLVIGLGAVAIAMLAGGFVGVVAGYVGGRVDALLMRLMDVWLSLPAFLLLLGVVAALGPGVGTIVAAMAVAATPSFARVVRGATLTARHLDYVEAARLSGSRHIRIALVHVVPAISGLLAVYVSLGIGAAILATSGLNFLGLGVQPPRPEWGAMLAVGNDYLREAWWMSAFPGAALFLTVLGVNLVGAGLRDLFDPRGDRGARG